MLLVGLGGLFGAIVVFLGALHIRRPAPMPRAEFLATLDQFITDGGDPEQWEAFCDVPVADADLAAAQRALSCIDEQYPPEEPGALCSRQGIAFLRRYREELARPAT